MPYSKIKTKDDSMFILDKNRRNLTIEVLDYVCRAFSLYEIN